MGIIGTIVVGFIVGLLARALKPGNDRMGLIMTTLLGIAGAFLARYAGMAMGWYTEGEPAGWIASIVGAILLLVIYGMVRGSSRPRV
ncbi:GlsB/YeaQ/YmgE family stress response membrane protein [Ramlibacter sp. Leaf400]|uniref:GlsB/YeaQ/YmgE family stress response membrane protein n=1 Tax=Ramlibacter sp. Leaf400 TaxID=1736365 RepID=UPI0006F1EA65|nr:GlsB/YeaQ/YmgE family stress response membrane protein [Ramlibacter sp. Leaf400]KQT12152.1 transglycosylase [Ramlibacter sp. Leaf400]